MSDANPIEANYCPVCGSPVAAAHAVAITNGGPIPDGLCGAYERAGAHAVIDGSEIRVYRHAEVDDA